MAITFEEKSNIGKNIVIAFTLVLLLAVAGFMAWKLSQSSQVETAVVPMNNVQINKKVLSDSRISSLELFPEIPAATIGEVRQNPFIKEVPVPKTETPAVDSVNLETQPKQ